MANGFLETNVVVGNNFDDALLETYLIDFGKNRIPLPPELSPVARRFNSILSGICADCAETKVGRAPNEDLVALLRFDGLNVLDPACDQSGEDLMADLAGEPFIEDGIRKVLQHPAVAAIIEKYPDTLDVLVPIICDFWIQHAKDFAETELLSRLDS